MRLTDPANIRTLYIDRDPVTFQIIARHLQGISYRKPAMFPRANEGQDTIFDLKMERNL